MGTKGELGNTLKTNDSCTCCYDAVLQLLGVKACFVDSASALRILLIELDEFAAGYAVSGISRIFLSINILDAASMILVVQLVAIEVNATRCCLYCLQFLRSLF